MIKKNVTIAYRCSSCAREIGISLSVFDLSTPLLSYPCSCKSSALKIELTDDKKIRLTVPCVACGTEHHYRLNASLVFEKDLFVLQCATTGFDVCFIGDEDKVVSALEKSNEEFIKALEEMYDEEYIDEYDDTADLDDCEHVHSHDCDCEDGHKKTLTPITTQNCFNPVVVFEMMFIIKELAKDGKIYCGCGERNVTVGLGFETIEFSCPTCKKTRSFAARAESDRAFLEDLTEIKI